MTRHRRRNTKGRRHTKKGGYYGAAGPIAVGAMRWDAGNEVEAPKYAQAGGKRRRTHRKNKRKVRGGGKYGGVSASYEGTGYRGIPNHRGIDTKTAPLPGRPAALGGFNDNGDPPGNFAGFAGMFPK